MLVPNSKEAVVDIRKLRDYCLDKNYPVGKHKAVVFEAALDLRQEDAEELSDALLFGVKNSNAEFGKSDEFVQRYTIDFEMERNGKMALIRSGWIIEPDSEIPHLTTCFVL